MKKIIEEKILGIIQSDEFKFKLNNINENYFNLKQENLIRNVILENLNEFFFTENLPNLKAFAEHPRENNKRVDLSISNRNYPEKEKTILKIEFKFQFSNDSNQLKTYNQTIDKDFNGKRNSDMFILIVANWDINERKVIDNFWGIKPTLSKYISKGEEWKNNILNEFKKFEPSELDITQIQIEKPYPTDYHFYVLKRRS